MRSIAVAVVCVAAAACSCSSTMTPDGSAGSRLAVDAGNAPSQGPALAPVTVVEFGDFECPYCGQEEPVVTQMLSDYAGRIRFVFKEFPLSSIHPDAELAAEAALAANAQGQFWPYHNMLYANQSALARSNLDAYASTLGLDMTAFDAALDEGTYEAAVAADVAQGRSLGVTGTPTFFVNGIAVVGAAPYSQLQTVIDQQIAVSP